ncbi:MAG: DUF5723 family protein [Paludibacter sp.]
MKRIIISISILLVTLSSVYSQAVHSVYFLNEWSQRHTLNAAFAPEYGYFSLPVLGGIDLSVNTNMGLNNFIFPYQNEFVTFMHPSVDAQTFINGLKPDNFMRQSLELNLLSFGFYTKQNSFWSFDITMKENLNVNLPIDLFRFMKLGMASPTSNNYDLKNLGIEQTNIAQIALGYSRDINSQFRIGVNAKMLVGLSTERINYSKFDISLSQSKFEINAVGESQIAAGFLSLPTDPNSYYDMTKPNINIANIQPAGIGLAIDLGVTYKPIKNLTLAVGINDLGYMKWNASSITRGLASSDVVFNGFSNVDVSNVNLQGQIDTLVNGLTNIAKFKQAATVNDISESIPYNIKASAEYSIFGNDKHDILVGVLFHSYNSKSYSVNELVAALTLKPLSWFTLSGTCSLLNQDFNRYGVALKISPRRINLYIASDFIAPKVNKQFIPIDHVNMNLIFGGSIVIGKPKIKDLSRN